MDDSIVPLVSSDGNPEIEEWRAVVGCEGHYEVSSLGRVRGLPRIIMRSNGYPQTWRGRVLAFCKTKPSGQCPIPHVTVWVSNGPNYRQKRAVEHLVYEAFIGPIPPDMEIDHRDRNPSNNRPGNLRLATRSQNIANRPASIRNTSGVKGVWWSESIKRWRARIIVNGVQHYLGVHKRIEDAAAAYRAAAEHYYGDYACHD